MKRRFEKELEKLFKGFTIEVVDLDKTIPWKDKQIGTQTLELNGKQFGMSWAPPLASLKEKDIFGVLFEDCKKEIENFIKENGQESS